MPGSEIRAEWAAQRIRTLSFWRVVRAALLNDGGEVHSLIEQFHYPRLGPGQMWEAMAAEIVGAGGELRLASRVTRIELAGGRVCAVHAGGERLEVEHVISSLPLRDVVAIADPPAPPAVLAAARGLRYRDFLTVALVVRGDDLFPDNWIYVHDPEVRVGRIQNFRAWSEAMVPDADRTCVGLEYFCFEGDDLWTASDDELVARATGELARIGLADAGRVEAGYVVRVPKAYPIYDEHYERAGADRARVARRHREPPADRPQRPAPLQQLRPLDADRAAGGRERVPRRGARPVGGELRRRVPRGARGPRAALPRAPETPALREELAAAMGEQPSK